MKKASWIRTKIFVYRKKKSWKEAGFSVKKIWAKVWRRYEVKKWFSVSKSTRKAIICLKNSINQNLWSKKKFFRFCVRAAKKKSWSVKECEKSRGICLQIWKNLDEMKWNEKKRANFQSPESLSLNFSRPSFHLSLSPSPSIHNSSPYYIFY